MAEEMVEVTLPELDVNTSTTAIRENWSPEKVMEARQEMASKFATPAEPAKPADPVVTTPVKEDKPADDKAAATKTDPPKAEAPAIDFSKWGVDNEDDLVARITRSREWEPLVAEYEKAKPLVEEYNRLKPTIDLLPQVESPFVDDNVQALNNFIRETGITGKGAWALAERVLNTDKAELAKDPLTALAVAKILDDKGYAELGIDKIRNLEAKRFGIDPTTPYEDLTTDEKDSLLYESVTAVKKIEEAKNKFAVKGDIFTSLRSQRAELQQKFEQNSKVWDDLGPKVAGSIKALDFEVEDEELGTIKVPLAVSEEMVRKELQTMLPLMKQGQVANDEGAKYLAEVLKHRLQSVSQQQRDKELVKTIKGIIRESLIKEKTNGSAPSRTDKQSDGTPKQQTINDVLNAERAARK